MSDERKNLIAEMERIRRERDVERKKNEIWLLLFRKSCELFSLHRVGPFRHEMQTDRAVDE